MDYPTPVQNLIAHVSRLPGIGKRSAERIALHLLKANNDTNRQLAQAILDAKAKIRNCSRCGSYTEHDPCEICDSPRRDQSSLCVVEGPNDILTLERAGVHKGVYHALMGRISPLDGVGPEQLRISNLISRVATGQIEEVILATNPTVEGEATATYLAQQLKRQGLRVTRIAMGIPVGSDIEYTDEVTMLKAMEGRREV